MKKLINLIFIFYLIFSSIYSFAADTPNLIKNGDFEETSQNDAFFWVTSQWEKEENVSFFSVDSTKFHSGGKSVKIENKSKNDARFKQTISVKLNKYYRLSCWIKTKNVGLDKKGANLSIDGIISTTKDIRGTSNTWEYVEMYGKTSDTQDKLEVTIGLGGYGNTNTGIAWFDDVKVEELNGLPVGKTAVNLFTEKQEGLSKISKYSDLKYVIIMILVILVILAVISLLKIIKQLILAMKIKVQMLLQIH